MNTIQIKILLLKSGIRQTDIAKELGVTVQAVNGVVNGRKHSQRIEKYILSLRSKNNNSKAA